MMTAVRAASPPRRAATRRSDETAKRSPTCGRPSGGRARVSSIRRWKRSSRRRGRVGSSADHDAMSGSPRRISIHSSRTTGAKALRSPTALRGPSSSPAPPNRPLNGMIGGGTVSVRMRLRSRQDEP
jgi:hypothetical protein